MLFSRNFQTKDDFYVKLNFGQNQFLVVSLNQIEKEVSHMPN